LHTLYQQAKDFIIKKNDEVGEDVQSYHYCLLLIKTTKDEVFGAFITAFPTFNPRVTFVGTQESFVFKVCPGDFEVYDSSGVNNFYMHADFNSITIGSGGDGPAIRLDKDLHEGRTCYSETF
jgi:hypothetical protein